MNWYYAQDGQQRGPCTPEQLAELAAQGLINDTTLVWHEGLAGWQPWGTVKPAGENPAPAAAPPAAAGLSLAGRPPEAQPGQVRCAECGGLFAEEAVVRFGPQAVCAACKPVFLQRLREGVQQPQEIVLATIWQRFLADFVDGLIFMVPFFVLGVVFGATGPVFLGTGGTGTGASVILVQVLMQAVFFGGAILYNGLLIGKYGYTPGKKALGLRVVLADGSPIGYGRAFGRAAAEILSGMACYIGYLIAFFDKEKRSLHDHICNTRVVKR